MKVRIEFILENAPVQIWGTEIHDGDATLFEMLKSAMRSTIMRWDELSKGL